MHRLVDYNDAVMWCCWLTVTVHGRTQPCIIKDYLRPRGDVSTQSRLFRLQRASAPTGLSQLAHTAWAGAGGWCGEWQSISSNNSSTFSCAGSVCSLHHPHHILDTWSSVFSVWCIELMIRIKWFLDLLRGQSDLCTTDLQRSWVICFVFTHIDCH